MKYGQLFEQPFTGKTIVIIGSPASGKTTFGKALAAKHGQRLIHTDDYMQHDYKTALYVMLADLIEIDEPVIVEGMQGYRLLRKGVELGNFFPDVVIELSVTDEQVERVYRTERKAEKLPKLSAFNKMHQTILANYKAMENPHPPQWIEVKNDY
jgi:hypothetical protein